MRKKDRPFVERLGFARNGIASAWRSEASFRWQLAAAAALLVLLAIVHPPAFWWAILIVLAALVPAAELFNTAIERVIDRLHPEHHADLEIAKDCAAGAVLVLSLAAMIVFVVFVADQWPR